MMMSVILKYRFVVFYLCQHFISPWHCQIEGVTGTSVWDRAGHITLSCLTNVASLGWRHSGHEFVNLPQMFFEIGSFSGRNARWWGSTARLWWDGANCATEERRPGEPVRPLSAEDSNLPSKSSISDGLMSRRLKYLKCGQINLWYLYVR